MLREYGTVARMARAHPPMGVSRVSRVSLAAFARASAGERGERGEQAIGVAQPCILACACNLFRGRSYLMS